MRTKQDPQPGTLNNNNPSNSISLGRILWLTLIASTCIGLFWIITRTYIVRPGKVATITHTRTGEMNVLQSGMHILLSPFTIFNGEMPGPKQTAIKQYSGLKARTADGVEISATADIMYRVTDPIATIENVSGNLEDDIRIAISASLSQVLRDEGTNFRQLACARTQVAPNPAMLATGKEKKEEPPADFASTTIRHLNELLLNSLKKICERWGIEFTLFQIVDPKATDPKIEQEYEKSAQQLNQAVNNLAAADSEKKRKIIEAEAEKERISLLAEGEAKRIEITTAAQMKRLQDLGTAVKANPEAAMMETQIAVAKSLAENRGMLAISLSPGTSATPFSLFTPPQQVLTLNPASDRKSIINE